MAAAARLKSSRVLRLAPTGGALKLRIDAGSRCGSRSLCSMAGKRTISALGVLQTFPSLPFPAPAAFFKDDHHSHLEL